MVDNYKKYIEDISNNTNFITSTIEKVERLLSILEWINSHEMLSNSLVLKGGTAINTVIFNFPRLSVDIDLDLSNIFLKNDMLKFKETSNKLLLNYLKANGYNVNSKKSKNTYALNSIVAEYTDIKGNIDNIKIEINYMKRTHILATKQLNVNTNVFPDKNFKINCVNPIEIYADKICALLNRITARDLFDVYTLSKYGLFDESEKQLLRQCFLFEYIAVNNYKLDNLNINNIKQISQKDINTKLLPTLRDRNPQKHDLNIMVNDVQNYLNDIIYIDDKTNEFYNNFQKGIYQPELLFSDTDILKRVNKHPMVLWKLNNSSNGRTININLINKSF